MSESARPGSGDVEIVLLDGEGRAEKLYLVPTYAAARTLSAQAGGLMKMMERVGALDMEAVTQVITLGLGYGSQTRRGPKDLPDRIWRTGLTDDTGGLAERCAIYIRVLMSGGQMPKDEVREDADRDPTAPGTGET